MKLAQVVKQEIPILEYAVSKGLTPVRVGAGEYSLAEHDSVRIDTDQNLCFRHATGEGGSIIDFVMMLEHIDGNWCDKHKALGILRDYLHRTKPYMIPELDGARPKQSATSEIEKKELVLPERVKGRFNRVFAYLSQQRCIDPGIISDFMHNNRLYEDINHNCIFVGYDQDNTAAYAMRRGTLTDRAYKGDVAGSRKEVGFYVDNGSMDLFVTEGVIDAMSIMTLLKSNGMDYGKYNYLSLGGTASKALLYHLPESGIDRIFLALDNDAAGRDGKAHIREALQKVGYTGKVIDKTPLNKDFNEDLQHIVSRSAGRTQEQAGASQSKKQHMER